MATALGAPTVPFLVSNWKRHERHTLKGFFTITLPSGMVIHCCSFHEKESEQWVSMPSQKFDKADGSTGFKPIIEFVDKAAKQRFQQAAVEAVRRYLAAGGGR